MKRREGPLCSRRKQVVLQVPKHNCPGEIQTSGALVEVRDFGLFRFLAFNLCSLRLIQKAK